MLFFFQKDIVTRSGTKKIKTVVEFTRQGIQEVFLSNMEL
jgi:hypothetical protein